MILIHLRIYRTLGIIFVLLSIILSIIFYYSKQSRHVRSMKLYRYIHCRTSPWFLSLCSAIWSHWVATSAPGSRTECTPVHTTRRCNVAFHWINSQLTPPIAELTLSDIRSPLFDSHRSQRTHQMMRTSACAFAFFHFSKCSWHNQIVFA